MAGIGIAKRGIGKIIKKLAPKKTKKFPGPKAGDQLSKKSKESIKYSPQNKGLDVYERINRDKTRRDRIAREIKDFRSGKNVGKADSKNPKIRKDQSKVFPQTKKQLEEKIKVITNAKKKK